jgi:hypothetical protein
MRLSATLAQLPLQPSRPKERTVQATGTSLQHDGCVPACEVPSQRLPWLQKLHTQRLWCQSHNCKTPNRNWLPLQPGRLLRGAAQHPLAQGRDTAAAAAAARARPPKPAGPAGGPAAGGPQGLFCLLFLKASCSFRSLQHLDGVVHGTHVCHRIGSRSLQASQHRALFVRGTHACCCIKGVVCGVGYSDLWSCALKQQAMSSPRDLAAIAGTCRMLRVLAADVPAGLRLKLKEHQVRHHTGSTAA